MTAQTMVETILSRKIGRDVLPNDMIVAPVDIRATMASFRSQSG